MFSSHPPQDKGANIAFFPKIQVEIYALIHALTCTQTHTQTKLYFRPTEEDWAGLLKGRHGYEAKRGEREANSLRNIVSFEAGV